MVNSQVPFPEDWKRRTLSELSDGGFQNGLFFEVDRKNKGVPIINVGDLYGDVPISNRMALFDATLEEIKSFGVKSGDVFFTRSSIVPSGIAMCNVYLSEEEKPVVFDSHVIKYSANRKQVNPVYLALQCRMPFARNHLIGRAKTATMTTIDQKGIGSCPIYMPDVPEQDAIVDTLATFDAYIANLSELIEKKKAIRDGALEDLMSGRTRLAGFTQKWIDTTINAVTQDVITGGTPSTSHPEYWGGTIPWLASTEIHQKMLSRETTQITELGLASSSAKIAPAESVLIALAGQGKTRGTAAYLLRPMALNQSLAALVSSEKMIPKFLYYLMDRLYLPLRELSSGDGGRGGLNKKLLKGLSIYIPLDIEEQKAIADVLTAMDDEITALEDERNKMIQIREGAMDDLLTGRVRLPI